MPGKLRHVEGVVPSGLNEAAVDIPGLVKIAVRLQPGQAPPLRPSRWNLTGVLFAVPVQELADESRHVASPPHPGAERVCRMAMVHEVVEAAVLGSVVPQDMV